MKRFASLAALASLALIHTPVAAQAAREVVSLPILPLGSQDESFERVCAAVRRAADVAAS